jgi:hypothetical protein
MHSPQKCSIQIDYLLQSTILGLSYSEQSYDKLIGLKMDLFKSITHYKAALSAFQSSVKSRKK